MLIRIFTSLMIPAIYVGYKLLYKDMKVSEMVEEIEAVFRETRQKVVDNDIAKTIKNSKVMQKISDIVGKNSESKFN